MTFNFSKTQDYDEQNADEYIAYEYPIVWTNKQKHWYEPKKNEPGFFISATLNPNKHTVSKYSIKAEPGNKFLPMLHQNAKGGGIQRSVITIFGSSGSGKSTVTTRLCQIYHGLNPDNKIYYISSKNMLIDPSFKKELYSYVNFADFMEKYSDDEELDNFRLGHDLDNTLLVFDDLIFKDNKQKQKFYDGFMTILLNLKRMNYVSCIYAIHETSDYKNTRLLFNEMTAYICFPQLDLKNRSSLILKDKLKLNKNEIKKITSSTLNSRYVCVMTRERCVVTENEIFSLVD